MRYRGFQRELNIWFVVEDDKWKIACMELLSVKYKMSEKCKIILKILYSIILMQYILKESLAGVYLPYVFFHSQHISCLLMSNDQLI